MQKITKLEPQKRKGRINVYIDGGFSFGATEELVVDYDLYVGKKVSNKDIKNYKEGESYKKCLDKSYSLLAIRPRSEKELRDKLKEKFEDNNIEKCITKLKEYKYINDVEFANKWVAERSIGRGKCALSFELRKKGISDKTIEESLANINSDSEFNAALLLIESKKKYQNLSKDEAYKKVGSFLSRRGFTYDVVRKVVEKIHK